MKIENVNVYNWFPPGEEWWANVKSKPTEQLLYLGIQVHCSWTEYQDILKMNKAKPKGTHEN